MSEEYTCENCNEVFKSNKKLLVHKMNCKEHKISDDIRLKLSNIFKNCLNALRSEGTTGIKAINYMSYFMVLKLIENHFGDEIDIDNYEYDFSMYDYDEETTERYKQKLLSLVRFSNLAKENEKNLKNIFKELWENVLSVNPSTEKIFKKNKYFEFKHDYTYGTIVKNINEIPENDFDILGEAYENFLQYGSLGKDLGQFFTPPIVKNMMIKLIEPTLYEDGTIDTCGDPAMGTGGFLTSYLKEIQDQAKEHNISIDWEYIKKKGLFGKEIESDTYNLAVSNMLISSGHMMNNIINGDSIREPINKKFDVILSNPPFGISGLKYDQIDPEIRFEYAPVKTDNAVCLFLQSMIHMLKINGRCAVVLPNGQELFSKTNKAFINVREYLMKTCDLEKIIYIPNNVFTNTSIKTCVFYFVKKVEGLNVIEIKGKKSKSDYYKFVEEHQTTSIKFYEFSVETEKRKLLKEVSIEDLSKNSYSLNLSEYEKEEKKEKNLNEGTVIKKLREVCEFKNGKGLKKSDIKNGNYPVIGGGRKPIGFHNQFNNVKNTILCSSSGAGAGYISRYEENVWASDCFSIKPKKDISNNYLYCFLSCNQDKIYKLQNGLAQPHVYSKDLEKLDIPVPSLESQQEIVEYCKFYDNIEKEIREKIKNLENEIDKNKEHLRNYINMQ